MRVASTNFTQLPSRSTAGSFALDFATAGCLALDFATAAWLALDLAAAAGCCFDVRLGTATGRWGCGAPGAGRNRIASLGSLGSRRVCASRMRLLTTDDSVGIAIPRGSITATSANRATNVREPRSFSAVAATSIT
jgi:hypothetical protein